MKSFFIVNGSPRPNGNCALIAARMAEAIETHGHRCNRIDMRRADIKPCRGCDGCKKHDYPWCSMRDQFTQSMDALETCDGLVVLAPIYFGQVSAQAKTFIDRLYSFYNPAKPGRTVSRKTDKRGIAITTSGAMPQAAAQRQADHVAGMILPVAGFTEHQALAVTDINEAGAIADAQDALSRIDEMTAWMLA